MDRFSQRRRVSTGLTSAAPVTRQARQTSRSRQRSLVDAVARLDTGLDEAARRELAAWIDEHYRVDVGDVPVGLVAVCHLGPPFVDHRLDLFHDILDHYAAADPMPAPFDRARMLVRSGAYAYAEVFESGTVSAVRQDGTVITV